MCLFCVFKSDKATKRVEPSILPSTKQPENNKTDSGDLKVENVDSNQTPVLPQTLTSKCNFCNKCADCLNQAKKEKQEKLDQAELKSNLKALNYFSFIILFLFILSCNTTIWFLIGS